MIGLNNQILFFKAVPIATASSSLKLSNILSFALKFIFSRGLFSII